MHEDETGGSFGPDTDLVLSLFAVVLLILAIKTIHEDWSASWRSYLGALSKPRARSVPDKEVGVLVEITEDHAREGFEQDLTSLSPAAVATLNAQVERIRRALENGECDQLQIQGFASPESIRGQGRRREKWNLTLSIARALAVIDHLYSRGIPYECMALSGYGRSHSGLMGAWLGTGVGNGAADWDRVAGELFATNPEQFARERLVWVVGIRHPCSACPLLPRKPDRTAQERCPGILVHETLSLEYTEGHQVRSEPTSPRASR